MRYFYLYIVVNRSLVGKTFDHSAQIESKLNWEEKEGTVQSSQDTSISCKAYSAISESMEKKRDVWILKKPCTQNAFKFNLTHENIIDFQT